MTPRIWLASALCAFGMSAWAQSPATWRGNNWIPGTSVTSDNVFAWLPGPISPFSTLDGQFREEVVAAEVARMAASGLNSVRLIPSFWGFLIDRAAYIDTLGKIARICNAHGIKITYMVWSAIGLSTPAVALDGSLTEELWHELVGTSPTAVTNPQLYVRVGARTLQTNAAASLLAPLPANEPFFSSLYHEPGNELIALSGDYTQWPYGMAARVDAYLDAIATFFAVDPDGVLAFGSYDLFNEPNGGFQLSNIPVSNYIQFIRTTENRLLAIHAGASRTIGWAGADAGTDQLELAARAAGYRGTYYSFHSYAPVDSFRFQMIERKAFADTLGVEALCSEFHRMDATAGRLPWLVGALREIGVGGQVWGFLQNNTFGLTPGGGFEAIDGVFLPVPGPAGLIQFQPQNVVDAQASLDWAAGAPLPLPHTRFLSPGTPADPILPWKHLLSDPFTLTLVSPLVGEPVELFLTTATPGTQSCVAASSASCSLILGLGLFESNATTQTLPWGVIPPSGELTLFKLAILPASLAGQAITLQALVGTRSIPWIQNSAHLTEPVRLQFY